MSHQSLQPPVFINAVVEGPIDEAVFRRLLLEARALPGRVHVKNGRSKIEDQIQGYNRAAQFELAHSRRSGP